MAVRKIYYANIKGRSTCSSPQKIQVFALFNFQFLLTVLKNFKIFGVKSYCQKFLSNPHLKHLYLWDEILGVCTRQAKCVATCHHETLEVTVRNFGLLHSQERYEGGRIRAEYHHCDNIRRDAHKPARVWLRSCAVTCQRNDENYSRRNFSQLNFASLIRPSSYCSWSCPQQSKLGVKRNVARQGTEW